MSESHVLNVFSTSSTQEALERESFRCCIRLVKEGCSSSKSRTKTRFFPTNQGNLPAGNRCTRQAQSKIEGVCYLLSTHRERRRIPSSRGRKSSPLLALLCQLIGMCEVVAGTLALFQRNGGCAVLLHGLC